MPKKPYIFGYISLKSINIQCHVFLRRVPTAFPGVSKTPGSQGCPPCRHMELRTGEVPSLGHPENWSEYVSACIHLCVFIYDATLLCGVGWGGVITFICISSHTWCYATVCRLALPHIHDATLLHVVLHFLTYMMLRYCMSSCTSSHTWCYATVCRLALPHIHDATLLYVVLHFLTYMMLRYCMSSCTSSHTWCYATVCRLALPHIHDATLLYVVLHFLTDMMLRYCMSSCTSSQIWCYATVCRLALPHIYDATLLYVVLHFLTDMMLRYCVGWVGWVGWGNNVHLHFLTYMMLRYCVGWGGVGWGGVITFICTSSHIWCYATVCRLALPHIYDATLLYVVLHFLTDMMLR